MGYRATERFGVGGIGNVALKRNRVNNRRCSIIPPRLLFGQKQKDPAEMPGLSVACEMNEVRPSGDSDLTAQPGPFLSRQRNA